MSNKIKKQQIMFLIIENYDIIMQPNREETSINQAFTKQLVYFIFTLIFFS